MNRLMPNVVLFAALGMATFSAWGQTAPPAQAPKPTADPYANNADAGKLRFPLAAPAGKDRVRSKADCPAR
jgi:hypothetical protein